MAAETETAFVLIKLEHSTPAEVARLLRALQCIDAAHAVMGEYDVLAVVRAGATRGVQRRSWTHMSERSRGSHESSRASRSRRRARALRRDARSSALPAPGCAALTQPAAAPLTVEGHL